MHRRPSIFYPLIARMSRPRCSCGRREGRPPGPEGRHLVDPPAVPIWKLRQRIDRESRGLVGCILFPVSCSRRPMSLQCATTGILTCSRCAALVVIFASRRINETMADHEQETPWNKLRAVPAKTAAREATGLIKGPKRVTGSAPRVRSEAGPIRRWRN
jgi:hypothetical protein